MATNYLEEIFHNSFFKILKKDEVIIVKLNKENNILISSWLNGGICHNMDAVVNQSIDETDYDDLLNMDYDSFQMKKFNHIGLNPSKTTGLLTSACMDNYAISTKKYEQLEVTSIVTAGADKNAVKAGDSASFYEYNNHYFTHFGTINIITLIDANLNDGALVTASITATEAKTSILQDLKIESQYSNFIATGTGTDGISIVSNKSSSNHLENAGKHSKLGELIAKTVQEATTEALYLQTFMSKEFQATVLSRLSRFGITFDNFYKEDINKLDHATKFYAFNNNPKNVAFVSSIINLVDEVQTGLIELSDVIFLVRKIINSYLGVNLDKKIEYKEDIIDLLVDSINQHLFDQNNG